MDENKQTTETYAVRLNTEVKAKLENFIKEYKDKGTQGDFIKLLIETFETNNLYNTLHNSEADLRELTTRMYSIFSNMVERNNTNIEGVISRESERRQVKAESINKLEEAIEELKEKNYIGLKKTSELNKENEKLLEEIEILKNRASKDDIFIHKLTEEVKEIQMLRVEQQNHREQIIKLQDKNFEDREKLQDKYSDLLDKYEKEKVEFKKLIEELRGK